MDRISEQVEAARELDLSSVGGVERGAGPAMAPATDTGDWDAHLAPEPDAGAGNTAEDPAEEVFIPEGPDMTDPDVVQAFRDQFRMTRIQIYDWGTFSGVCSIPIAPKGYLLLGPSGAGKSTVLDAISAMLVPPRWLDFNASARVEDKRGPDRNLLSYVRGAWAEQTDTVSGGTAVQYLRRGTTWSAIAMTYETAAGRAVTLVQLFTVRGASNSNVDVKRLYLIFERTLDLQELECFGQTNFDVRKLKQTFPTAFVRDEFSAYSERFFHLLGIESDRALKLLHKTQSAKNLGDLNSFLREFMLDRPDTFEAAEQLVSEFGELNLAHKSVVTAREQVEALRPAKADYVGWQQLQEQERELKLLRDGLDGYRESLESVLSVQRLDALAIGEAGLEGSLQSLIEDLNAQTRRQNDLQLEFAQAGGGLIEQWKSEQKRLELERAQCSAKRGRAEAACKALGLTLPTTAQKYAALASIAQRKGEEWDKSAVDPAEQDARDDLVQQKALALGQLKSATEEAHSLRRRRSNIPARLTNFRQELAAALSLSESSLPFAGELIEVKSEEAEWTGAVERVLRGFATDILVDDRNYGAVAAYVNGRNLGMRVVYQRVRTERDEPLARQPGAASLVYKLNVNLESPFASWVLARLQRQFDYTCVADVTELKLYDFAVTREGQKRDRSRHEKDDRFDIRDRSQWVLGFDNQAKLAVYEARMTEANQTLEALAAQIDKFDSKQQARLAQVAHWSTLYAMQWPDIDVESRVAQIADLARRVQETESGDSVLAALNQKLVDQQRIVYAAHSAKAECGSKLDDLRARAEALHQKVAFLELSPAVLALTEFQRAGLAERYGRLPDPVTLENHAAAARVVDKGVGEALSEVGKALITQANQVVNQFEGFKRKWPLEAADLDASLGSAPDYFAKLERLETDDLPRHEARFFDLLKIQSSQSLTVLLKRITYAQGHIQDRMRRVNESLSRAQFNTGTYLSIDAKDRNLKEAVEFKLELQRVRAPLVEDEDEVVAEERFRALRDLVAKLGSADPVLQRWREAVLDVRQHFEFIGREANAAGEEMEVYRGSSGKSGGQRQKLTTTCLAAALRYQLGGDNANGIPVFAPVVMDEAFDKADNAFTKLAMNIFTNFGFQMIVATPLKSVMTLERFIGGAGYVSIRNRKESGVTLIEYDDARQRLALPERTLLAMQAAEDLVETA
jgi:uncharacterized protein YPO0396